MLRTASWWAGWLISLTSDILRAETVSCSLPTAVALLACCVLPLELLPWVLQHGGVEEPAPCHLSGPYNFQEVFLPFTES